MPCHTDRPFVVIPEGNLLPLPLPLPLLLLLLYLLPLPVLRRHPERSEGPPQLHLLLHLPCLP
jgi:hypothetical protein